MKTVFKLLLSALLASFSAAAVTAQTSQQLISIVVETSTNLPKQSPVFVEMTGRGEFANVLLVDESKADADDIASAIMLIKQLRLEYGDTLSKTIRATPPTRRPGHALINKEGSESERYLRSLRSERPKRSLLGEQSAEVKRIRIHVNPLKPKR
ncbi:MAG: hypothetical protein ACO1Q7_06275 [Gemmatimonas sp.]